MDYRNTLKDRKLLIYGHNSKTLKNALFHDLEKYLKKSFYKNNKYIELVLNDETTKWQIFSVMIIKKSNNRHMKITFNDKEWIEHINWMMENSTGIRYRALEKGRKMGYSVDARGTVANVKSKKEDLKCRIP